jgi:hypothetical protein
VLRSILKLDFLVSLNHEVVRRNNEFFIHGPFELQQAMRNRTLRESCTITRCRTDTRLCETGRAVTDSPNWAVYIGLLTTSPFPRSQDSTFSWDTTSSICKQCSQHLHPRGIQWFRNHLYAAHINSAEHPMTLFLVRFPGYCYESGGYIAKGGFISNSRCLPTRTGGRSRNLICRTTQIWAYFLDCGSEKLESGRRCSRLR